jgi:protein tyrosine phosphatase (PTP) superfamily phosphohydrolase (DUF442 family)
MKPDLFGIPGPWNGKLSIAKRPRGGDWLEDEARGWVLAGLDSIISLLELDEAADLDLSGEASHAKTLGLQFTSFPIPDRNIPSSTPEAVRLLQAILKELEVGRSVAVHCRQGLGRSGMIAAGVLIQAGICSRNCRAAPLASTTAIEAPCFHPIAGGLRRLLK